MLRTKMLQLGVAFIIALMLAGLMIFAGRFIVPFEPYDSKNFSITPSIACPGIPVDVERQRRLLPGFYTVDTIEGETYWIYPQNGKPFNVDRIEPHNVEITEDYVWVESPVQKFSPLIPGRFPAGASLVIKGKALGFVPREQKVTIESDEELIVLGRGDPSCAPFNRSDSNGNR